jgi:FkbM family methyltransferase
MLSTVVPRDKIAVDIGANKGAYTYWLSGLCSQVVAFEPNSLLANRLQAASPDNVSVKNFALSDQAGTFTLYTPIRNRLPVDGEASLRRPLDGDFLEHEVKVGVFDEFELENVGFMKVDVEGLELSVLKGATQFFERERPVLLMEIESRHSSPDSVREVFDFFTHRGYAGCFLRGKDLVSLEHFNLERDQSLDKLATGGYVNNFFFFPEYC